VTDIRIERNATRDRLEALGVMGWAIWTGEVSTFSWYYETAETCYFLDGEAVITPERGEAVRVGRGDLVTFPAGLSCTWQVRRPVRKHYTFG
jgi:uncharacterized cupin superfamily protein